MHRCVISRKRKKREKKRPRKKVKARKKKSMIRKRLKGKKKNYWPSKLTPGGQFHPIHEISERGFFAKHRFPSDHTGPEWLSTRRRTGFHRMTLGQSDSAPTGAPSIHCCGWTWTSPVPGPPVLPHRHGQTSEFIYKIEIAIAPHHVWGCCTKVAIPILMNDVDLKPCYIPIVTVEMSLHIFNINVFIKMCWKEREKESGGTVLAAYELKSSSRTVLFCGGKSYIRPEKIGHWTAQKFKELWAGWSLFWQSTEWNRFSNSDFEGENWFSIEPVGNLQGLVLWFQPTTHTFYGISTVACAHLKCYGQLKMFELVAKHA